MNQRRAGALLSYVNIAATLLVGLLYTPLMLRLLGQSEYGLYSLIGAVAGYLSILDMGLGSTIVRYTARNRVVGDKLSESKLNGLFLAIYTLIGIVTAFIGLGMYMNIEALFGGTLSQGELQRARLMMLMLVINIAVTFPLSIFGSIMQAYERFVFLRVVNILRVLLNPCISLPFLFWGYGSVTLVGVTVFLNISCLLINVYYCFSKLHVKFTRGKFERAFLWEVMGYSFFIFLNAIMDKVYWGTGQFILGITVGTIEVAIYAVAMQFMMMYMSFSTGISGVLLPKVTMMVAEGASSESLTQLLVKIGRLQFMVVWYIFSCFLLVGRDFLSLWAGEGYLSAYPMVLLLMLALFIPLVQNAGIAILQAKNLNRYRMTAYTIAAATSFIVSFPASKIWGGMGCAICTAMALLVSTGAIMNRYYQRNIGLDMHFFWKNLGKMARMPAILLVISYVLLKGNAEVTWLNFLEKSVVYTVLYGLVLYRFSINDYEKGLCRSAWRRMRGIV